MHLVVANKFSECLFSVCVISVCELAHGFTEILLFLLQISTFSESC